MTTETQTDTGRSTRVAAVMDTGIVSGPGRQLAALALALREHGDEVHAVLFQRTGTARPVFADYLAARNIPFTIVSDRGPFDWRLVARMRRALEDIRPDVVQTHGYRPTTLLAILRMLGYRPPWLAFMHGETREDVKIRIYNWIDRLLVRLADRVVLVSPSQRDTLSRSVRRKVSVIPNAVLLPPAPTPEAGVEEAALEGRLPAHPRIGVLARLSFEKGIDVLIDAIAELNERGQTVSAVIAGDGPEREALESRAIARGLANRIEFLGRIENPHWLYPRVDLIALPSRMEAMPNVLLEAMAHDRPMVATTVGAVPLIVGDSDAVTLVPPGDSVALAAGITRELARRSDRAASYARRNIASAYSLTRRVDAHITLYEHVRRARST